MRLEQLEYLLEIHRTHSINHAAKKLHVSQQNISQSIKHLESELDLILLERGNTGTYLTDSGLVVLKHAQKILHEMTALNEDVITLHAQNSDLSGTLRIMYVLGFNVEYIYHSLEKFSLKYPKTKLYVSQDTIANVLSELYDGNIDLALIASGDDFHFNNAIDSAKLSSISIQFLKEDPLYAAVSHLSPLATQKTITLGKLIQFPLIFFYQEKTDPSESNYLYHTLKKHGEPNIRLVTNAFELYIKAIANNQGIGFVTQAGKDLVSSNFGDEIVLISIRPIFSLLQGYATNCTRPTSETLSAYLPFLLDEL